MSLILYLDEHIDGAIFKGLRKRGIAVHRVQDEDQRGTPDPLILDRALANQWTVFTCDRDFMIETHRRLETGEPFCGVIFNPHHDMPVGKVIEDLCIFAKCSEVEEFINRVEYLPISK